VNDPHPEMSGLKCPINEFFQFGNRLIDSQPMEVNLVPDTPGFGFAHIFIRYHFINYTMILFQSMTETVMKLSHSPSIIYDFVIIRAI
jgi:hypothetical protein